jgi:hypothetical protein
VIKELAVNFNRIPTVQEIVWTSHCGAVRSEKNCLGHSRAL